jgi:hypothetical protein
MQRLECTLRLIWRRAERTIALYGAPGNERATRAGASGYWREECLDGCAFTSESVVVWSMESDVLISVSNVRQRANVEVNCLLGRVFC